MTIRLQREDFDAAAEAAALARGRTDIGAVVTFSGICRDREADPSEGCHGVTALTLEHYPGMAEGEIAKIAQRAVTRWPLLALTVLHRYGRLGPGERIVLVLAAAKGRAEAFAAAEFLMDYLKTRAPFWKQEERAGGTATTRTTTRTWVAAKEADDAAAGRWNAPRKRDAAE